MAAKKGVYDALTTLFDPERGSLEDNATLSELYVITSLNISTILDELGHQQESMIFK